MCCLDCPLGTLLPTTPSLNRNQAETDNIDSIKEFHGTSRPTTLIYGVGLVLLLLLVIVFYFLPSSSPLPFFLIPLSTLLALRCHFSKGDVLVNACYGAMGPKIAAMVADELQKEHEVLDGNGEREPVCHLVTPPCPSFC